MPGIANELIVAITTVADTLGITKTEESIAKLDATQKANNATSGAWGASLATAGALAGVAIVAGAAVSIKAAGDYQASLVRLVTSAGETNANLKVVGQGMLQMARDTGTSTGELSKAMYIVESAGHHGADGLMVLTAAAQGAKAENANVATVADAVSSALQDYHLKASDAALVTSKFVTAIGDGKTTFEQFAGSLSSVLPIASAAHVSLEDVSAAIASMTVHGMSADQASQDLAHSIGKIQTPTIGMTNYLAQLGIKSSDLADKLGKKGITGTLQEISDAVMKQMGPSGKVLVDSLNQSKVAAEDVNRMMGTMPANLKSIAQGFKDGTISTKDFHKEIKGLPVNQANLIKQFASAENHARGFNSMLKSGTPEAKGYAAAMAAATGDTTTLNTALMLTGENTDYVNKAVKHVTKTTTESGNSVKGWADVQKTFNNKWDKFVQGVATGAIELGTKLLPAASSVLDAIGVMGKNVDSLTGFLVKNKDTVAAVATLLAIVFGPALVAVGVQATITGAKSVLAAVKSGSAWVLSGAKTSLQMEITAAKAIGSFIAMSVSAIVNAAVATASWVASATTSGGAITALRTLVATPMAMPAIAVAAAIAAIVLVYNAVLSVIGAIKSMNAAANANAASDAASAGLRSAAARGLASGKISQATYNKDMALAGKSNPHSSWFDNLLTGKSYASGTNSARGGLSLVGENGPELVNLPPGAQVNDANKSKSMMGNTNTHTFNIHIYDSNAANTFFNRLDQDGILVGKGLTPNRGIN
jgi:hypothetical protein